MRVRQDPVTIFSSFLVFKDNRSAGWVSVGSLRRNMLKVVPQPQQTWESYWYERYLEQSSPLPSQHLCAYLQSVCYQAAERIASRFSSNTQGLEDLFQAAILQTERILEKFNPELGYPLNHYAASVFESAIRQTLREKKEVAICSECSLLRSTSKKRLQEALKRRGLSEERLHQYVRAWQTFKLVYVPEQSSGTRALKWPEISVWREILDAYNHGLSFDQKLDDPVILEEWLKEMALASREYLYPRATSLNQTLSGFETGEWLDILVDESHQSGLEVLIANEEESARLKLHAQMHSVLLAALQSLEPKLLTMLQYRYADHYTQKHIGQLLREEQYTINRWLGRVHKSLLLALARWSQDHLHISPELDVLDTMRTFIDEWLEDHFNPSSPS